jgi:cyclase
VANDTLIPMVGDSRAEDSPMPGTRPVHDQLRGTALRRAQGRRSCVFEIAHKIAPLDVFADIMRMPITTHELAPGVAALEHTGGGGNMLVSHGVDGVVTVDLYFPDLVHRAHRAIRAFTDAPYRFAIPSHFHIDHAGGAEHFAEHGAIVVGLESTRARMASPHVAAHMGAYWDAFPEEAWPKLTFRNEMSLFLNGEEIVLFEMEHGHTDTDTCIYFLESNVMHVGDTFVNFPTYPFLEMNSGANSAGALHSIERVISLCDDSTVIVPGHGPLATRTDLVKYRDMLRHANDGVAARIAAGESRATVVAAAAAVLAGFAIEGAFIDDWVFIGDVYDSLASA